MTRLLPRAALALLAAAAVEPARAAGAEVEASARVGLSLPAGSQVDAALAYGLSARLAVDPRLRLELGAERAVHALSEPGGARISALTATAGVQAGLDLVPLVPFASAGLSFQYASRLGQTATASTYGAYLGLGVRARVWRGLTLSGQVRYLTSSFAADGFPSYTSFLAEMGWAVP